MILLWFQSTEEELRKYRGKKLWNAELKEDVDIFMLQTAKHKGEKRKINTGIFKILE